MWRGLVQAEELNFDENNLETVDELIDPGTAVSGCMKRSRVPSRST